MDIKKEEEKVVLPSETPEEKAMGDANEAKGLNRDGTPKQDPLKSELDRVQKTGKSKRDKLLYTKTRVENQLQELDKEEGIIPDEEEDEKPVTVGMLKKIEAEKATKTALQLADEIQDETERELAKYHIENTIRPSGNPAQDLANAMVHVNAVKNRQIVDEITRKPKVRQNTGAGGGNPQNGKIEEELTPQEISIMRFGNLTKAQVIAARTK
jgi:hypothetical protein